MAAAFVQSKAKATSSSTTSSIVLTSNVGAGNTLCLTAYADRTTVSSVSGGGATWSRLQSSVVTSGDSGELWVGTGGTTGTTITVTFAVSCFSDCLVAEFSGAPAAVTSAKTSGTSVTPSAAAVTATASGQAVYDSILQSATGAYTSFTDTPVSSFTTLNNLVDAGAATAYADAYAITTGTGTYQRVGANPSGAYVGFGVLLGATPPPSPRPRPPVVRLRAVTRAAVI